MNIGPVDRLGILGWEHGFLACQRCLLERWETPGDPHLLGGTKPLRPALTIIDGDALCVDHAIEWFRSNAVMLSEEHYDSTAWEHYDRILPLIHEVRRLRKSQVLLLDALEYMETYWPEQKAEAMRWAEGRADTRDGVQTNE